MIWTAALVARSTPARRRLVVFPHAGAGPSGYRPLVATGLPADTEILGVTLPGRERRMDEPYATDFRDVVRAIAEELLGLTAMPTVLFGHSFGAQLATGLASTVPGLCSGVMLSALPPPMDSRLPGEGDAIGPATLLAVGDTPAELLDDPELRAWLEHLLGADLNLSRQAPRLLRDADLKVPVVVLGGDNDPLVDPSTLAGWQRHAKAGFRTRLLPGGHFYYQDASARARVRAELRTLLEHVYPAELSQNRIRPTTTLAGWLAGKVVRDER